MLAWLCAAALGPSPAAAEEIFAATPRDEIRAEVLFLPDDAASLDRLAEVGEVRLTVTGAYSSGDRFAPEGFVIRRGEATHPFPQGWDGLLLIDAAGRPSLHFVEDVAFAGRSWNLRDRGGRQAFVARAEAAGVTALQSHLLINDGALDLTAAPGAPKFRRRLLFETADGHIGVWDTSPRPLTLYEAALELEAALAPRFALNLDMGAYDFCERREGDAEPERCGLLGRAGMQRLTNLLVLSR